MSVLLDALKKAALEKQKREGLAVSDETPDEQNVSGTNSSSESPSQNQAAVSPEIKSPLSNASTKLALVDDAQDMHEEKSTDVSDMDEQASVEKGPAETTFVSDDHEFIEDAAIADNHAAEIEMIVDLDPEILQATDGESDSLELEATYSDTQVENAAQTNPADETVYSDNSETGSSPELALENSDAAEVEQESKTAQTDSSETNTPPKMSDEDLKALLSNVAIDDDLVNQIENQNNNTAQDQRRVSFQRLLDKNREDAKKRKVRFLVLYMLVIVVAALVVASYFFYIKSETNNLAPVQTTSFVDIGEDDAVDSDPDSDNSGVEEEDTTRQNEKAELDQENVSGAARMKDQEAVMPSRRAEKIIDDRQTIKSSLIPAVKRTQTSSAVVEPSNNIITKGKFKSKPVGQNITIAYQAYQQGDFQRAAEFYHRALELDPYHRDALLGSAAVAVAQQRYQVAISFYQAQLNRRPDDDVANAGLLAIAAVDGATPDILSKVNQLLADNPNAAHLYFLKGSLFAKQKSWEAAQQAFFSAWSIESERADYTYNLAIALDHMRQYKEALRFYRLTLQLPNININTHQISQLNHRISQLEVLDE